MPATYVFYHRLSVMNSSGDLTFTWDPADPQETARIRAIVEQLRQEGYHFWRVDNTPVMEVNDETSGTLSARRVLPEEVVPDAAPPVREEPGTPINFEALSRPGARGLRRAALLTLEEAARHTAAQLLALEGVGRQTVERLAEQLTHHGLQLATAAVERTHTIAARPVRGG